MLTTSTRGTHNRVRLVGDDWICDDCEAVSRNSIRQAERLTEPENPGLYRHSIPQLLREFKEDLPELYQLLDVDGINTDHSLSHELKLDNYDW